MNPPTTTARPLVAVLLAGALLVAGCRDELPDATPTSSPTSVAPGQTQPDPHAAALAGAVTDLRGTLTAAREALAEAQAAPDPELAHGAATRAVHLLTAHPQILPDPPPADLGHRPLFPGPADLLPEDTSYDDQLAVTLNAARGAGAAGGEVVDVLRDPVAGDLGIWQRDAGGMLDLVDDAATGAVDTAEPAIIGLPGEATKALAWALLAARSRDPATVSVAAERGVAHLDLTLTALDELELP